jgi:carboxyl-terminal processing protease
VGETTFGKGLVQTVIPLRDGSAVAITTARYLTPHKRDINHKGIQPDYEVKLTEADLKAERDPQLEKALELVKKGLTHPKEAVSGGGGAA